MSISFTVRREFDGLTDTRVKRAPSPLAGEGWGGEYHEIIVSLTPTPDPSPQGGGEAPRPGLSQ